MGNILISVIVPIHQYGDYIFKCLDCLFEQTENKIEIIIVNDNSEDVTPIMLQKYINNSQCKYIFLDKKSGPGGARNQGMKIADGKFIGFCDSDDWVDLDYYRSACELLNQTNADIAMCSLRREYDSPLKSPLYKCNYKSFYELSGEMAFQIMTYNYDVGISVIPPCTNKVYTRSFIQMCKTLFQENIYFQDTIFSLETMLRAKKIICVPNVTYHHYRREGSIIQSFDYKHINSFKNLGISLKKYLSENGLYEKYKRNYYNVITHFYGIIIREIFEFVQNDAQRKKSMVDTFSALNSIINKNEYIEYITAEQLRYHLFPHMNDTTLY